MPKLKRQSMLMKKALVKQVRRQKRQEQSKEERSVHLRKNSILHATYRANELPDQKIVRLQNDAKRHVIARANESQVENSSRLEQDATRHKNTYAKPPSLGIGIRSIVNENSIPEYECGTLTAICTNCGSKNFVEEKPKDGKFTICCQKGRVVLPKIKTHEIIQKLLSNEHEHSKNFMENIRSFNSSFAYASMGAQLNSPPGSGPYCFRIQGQIYHRAGPLHPADTEKRKFAQLYILDPEEALKERLDLYGNFKCNPQLMEDLGNLFLQINPYAEAYKMLFEVEKGSLLAAAINGHTPSNVFMTIRQDRNSDIRRYNDPAVTEVAIIFKNNDGEPPLERDLVIHLRPDPNNLSETRTKQISALDNNLDPMVYPIFYPYGDQSWGPNLTIEGGRGGKRVTQMMFYSHQLSIRDEFNPFLSAGKLTQQYIVDAYIKTEANRLNWIRMNQKLFELSNMMH